MAWEIDATHSHVQFAVRQMAVRPIRGRFNAIHGYLHIDDENPMHSWVDAQIDAASVDTGNQERDARLRSADFLDAAQYPAITFKSSRVEHIVGHDFKVSGELTMHGVTQQVNFIAGFHEHSGANGSHGAILTARTRLICTDFGLGMFGAAGLASSEDVVTVEIDLTLVSRLTHARPSISGRAKARAADT